MNQQVTEELILSVPWTHRQLSISEPLLLFLLPSRKLCPQTYTLYSLTSFKICLLFIDVYATKVYTKVYMKVYTKVYTT